MFDERLVRGRASLRAPGLLHLLLAALTAFFLAHAASAGAATAPEDPGSTFPVSTAAGGELAAGGATEYTPVSISEDGRFVAFESAAGNLGEAGPSGAVEGFVKNLETGAVALATRADGLQGEPAAAPGVSTFTLSANGRYVLFTSAATNLGTELPGEEEGETHVYRRDLRTGETVLVDHVHGGEEETFSRGAEAGSISANGRYVTFTANVANLEDEEGDHGETADPVGYVSDLVEGGPTAVTRASGAEGELADGELLEGLAVSPDGEYVAFSSSADNLVPGVEGGESQIYLRDLQGDETTLLSQNAEGEAGDRSSYSPTFSGGEGCLVEFSSIAFNLLEPDPTEVSGSQAYAADRCQEPGSIELLSKDATHPIASDASGSYESSAVSADGGEALFGGYFGLFGPFHLYLRDRDAGSTEVVDRASGEGATSDSEIQLYALSANGCRAVFGSAASNLASPAPPAGTTQVYVRQLKRCAPPAQAVNVRIEGRAETLYEGSLPVTVHKIRASSDLEERYCDGINELDPQNTEPDVTPTLASAEAMESIGETFDGQWYGGFGDYFITRWGPDEQGGSAYWGILVNEVFTSVGGCQYQLDGDDQVLWVYDAFSGRPSLAMFPAEAHYESGPRPTEATATVGVPFPVEVVAYEDDVEDVPGEEPSRQGSHGYGGAEVAPVRTNEKGFQLVETASPETVVTNADGKASIVFTTPGVHRIKATVGPPGEEKVIRSNGIDVDVLPAETGPTPPKEEKSMPADALPPAPPAPPAPARVARPKLDRSGLAKGRLRVSWQLLDPGAGVQRWWIEAKRLGRKGAKFATKASGSTQTSATVKLGHGARYRLRFSLRDDAGHLTTYSLGSVSVPRAGGS